MLGHLGSHGGNMSEDGGGSLVVDVNVTSFDREYLHWSFIVMEVAAVVVIVIGDISMLMMFFTRKLLGQSTNILVFSVAIGDLVTGLLALPLAMMQKILVEPSDFLCKGYFYFANVSKTAVGYTILLLAMERIIAVLIHTFRILPPGRCLFFASLTWFFAAAYNIWSVVIYDVEVVTLIGVPDRRTKDLFLCFASSRFMYLHDIFEILNPLVTFAFPTIGSSLLFIYFAWNKEEADKPGRPYKSSRSVVIFTFALLVSFAASHLPWEIATLVLSHDAPKHYSRQLVSLKVLHLLSFLRGFWDIFIFGAFRHYVCKKEKALAHFREQRSLQVQRSSLAIPLSDRALSTSLLDSDPSVSRRYSSDVSRRPSAFDDGPSCVHIEQSHLGSNLHPNQNIQILHTYHPLGEVDHGRTIGQAQHEHQHHHLGTALPPRRSIDGGIVPAGSEFDGEKTIIVPVVTVGYLIPRSPCAVDPVRNYMFPPCSKSPTGALGRRMSSPMRHHFGSAEDFQEGKEDGDSLSELHIYRKRVQFNRRKSCGDRTAAARHLHQSDQEHIQQRQQQHQKHQAQKEIKDAQAVSRDPGISNNDQSCQQDIQFCGESLRDEKPPSFISNDDTNPTSFAEISTSCVAKIPSQPSLDDKTSCISQDYPISKVQADTSNSNFQLCNLRTMSTSASASQISERKQQSPPRSKSVLQNDLSLSSQSLTGARRSSNHLHVPSFIPRPAYSTE